MIGNNYEYFNGKYNLLNFTSPRMLFGAKQMIQFKPLVVEDLVDLK